MFLFFGIKQGISTEFPENNLATLVVCEQIYSSLSSSLMLKFKVTSTALDTVKRWLSMATSPLVTMVMVSSPVRCDSVKMRLCSQRIKPR